MRGKAGLVSHVRGWLVAGGFGLLAGYLVGLGMMGGYTHAKWPALAGFVLGVASALAAPARQVLVAFCGGGVAVVAAVAKIASVQLQSGRWPITDEVTAAQYGTATQAAMRAAVMLGALIGIPCLIAAFLVAFAKRRYPHADAPQLATAAGEPERQGRGNPRRRKTEGKEAHRAAHC